MIKNIHELFDSLDAEAQKLPTYQEDMMFDSEKTEKFVFKSNVRHKDEKGIQLMCSEDKFSRKSIRNFNSNVIPFKDFSGFLSILRSTSDDGKGFRYLYPSAGGLYPVDTYVCVKGNRVEGIDKGVYIYLPEKNQLKMVGKEIPPVNVHYFNNRNIYSSSAFSLCFFFSCNYSMPKYEGMGLYYGMLDSGIMLGLLSEKASEYKLGTCIIGDLNFGKAEKYFHLPENMIYLHCMEVGRYGL